MTKSPVLTHRPDNHKAYQHSDDPAFYIHNHNLDLQRNEIYLFGREEFSYGAGEMIPEPGVEFTMANQFIKSIRILQLHSPTPILVHMKTCGGMWEEGMAIYDAIASCPNEVIVLNYTHARSMSSLIPLAASKFVMMPHSTYMIHEGTFGFEGTQKQLRTEYIEAEKSMEEMLNIYVVRLKSQGKFKSKSAKWIREMLSGMMNDREEVYLTAKEAVEYGFADYVFGEDGTYDWKSLREFKD
jgi:ATP-dependent protease ClpP protease subunit